MDCKVFQNSVHVKMNCPTGKDYWLYSCIFYMCRSMGILPSVKSSHINTPPRIFEPIKGCFDVSRWGILFSVAHVLLLLLCGYQVNIDWHNILTLHAIFWIQNIGSALISILLTLFQLSSLSDQLSTACSVYYLYSHNTKSFYFFQTFLLVKPFVPIIYQLFWLPFLDYDVNIYFLRVNYVATHPAALEVVISSLCFIATKAYVDINQQLKTYQKSKFDSKSLVLLKQHLENYIFVSKYLRSLSAHFSAHFLNMFMSFILRTIVFVVFTVSSFKVGQFHDVKVFAFTSCYIVFGVFSVCYCCQKVKEEQIKTRIIVRRIRILWIDKIKEDEAFLLDTYEELMEVSAVEFSACGLFPINVEQGLNVMGIIATYGLVAAQA